MDKKKSDFTFICYHYLWSPWFLYNNIVLYSHKRVKHRWQIAKQYWNAWLSLLWLQYVIRCLMETSWTKKIQRLLDIWTKLESFSWKEHDNYHGDYNKTYDGDACKQKTCDMTVMHGKNNTCDMMVIHGTKNHMLMYGEKNTSYMMVMHGKIKTHLIWWWCIVKKKKPMVMHGKKKPHIIWWWCMAKWKYK